MKKLFLLSIISVCGFIWISDKLNPGYERAILENIEALAGNIEEGVKIRSCYLDKDIIEDLSAASKYTICNSQTTSSVMYKCGKDKQGGFKEYSTPTSYKCMY
ncbi:MAG: hypothetical protein EGP82_15925 [Odoribacter splanchnicus]|nr:hypothetical protein [Odoribacter splanchnicus]